MRVLLNLLKLACLFLLFSGASQAVAASKPTTKHKPTPLAEVPVDIVNNRVQFTMTVGDTQLLILLDTGATSSIFFQSEKLAAIAPDISGKTRIAFPALSRSVNGWRIKALTMKSGGFTHISRGGLLIEEQNSVAAQLEAQYEAIFGQDFFRSYTVEIDPANRLMRLYAPGTDLEPHYNSSHRLFMEGHTPHIKVFSEMPWEERQTSKALLLDTGYPGSMVLWSERHYRQAKRKGQIVSQSQQSTGIVSHITLRFGVLKFVNIPVFIAKHVPQQSMKRDGLVGASLLAQYWHVIDFANAQLLMSPIYGTSGTPLQIIDGLIYTPNNEDFDLKTYYPEIPRSPTLYIHANTDTTIR